jgi:hypothetical protein
VDEIDVTMTYPQMKIIFENLRAFIEVYEREIGPIDTPNTQKPDIPSIEAFVQNLKRVWGR